MSTVKPTRRYFSVTYVSAVWTIFAVFPVSTWLLITRSLSSGALLALAIAALAATFAVSTLPRQSLAMVLLKVQDVAWASSSFCSQLGIRFSQASVRSSMLAVSPGAIGLPDARHTAAVSVTRRAPQFLPMFARRWRSLAPGGLEGFRSGHESLTHPRGRAAT